MGVVRWLGHASFEISMDGITALIDPWIKGNPSAPISLSDVTKCDIVLVTHDHSDHLGDSFEICRRTGATFVSIYELCLEASRKGVKDVISMNVGGVIEVKGLKVIMVPAHHSSSIGSPVGFILKGTEGTIYHAGDTGIVYDVVLYTKIYPIDIALIPIGSLFTMDPESAAYFTSLIKPRVVIPMHYNTFPGIRQDPSKFEELVKKRSPETKVVTLKPGESWKF